MSMESLGDGRIEQRDLSEEMRSSYLDYAMSVIVGRALPDVRDGLKPVHRRVLFSMNESGLQPNRPTPSAPRWSATCWASTTRTATAPPTTRWCAWPSGSRCATRWWTARATSATRTATRPRPCATPSAGWRRWRSRCCGTSTPTPSTSCPTTTSAAASRSCCRRGSRTCSSTAPRGSPWAWPRTSPRTTWARRSTPPSS